MVHSTYGYRRHEDEWTQTRSGRVTLVHPRDLLSELEAQSLLRRCLSALSAVGEIVGYSAEAPQQVTVVLEAPGVEPGPLAHERTLVVRAPFDPERPDLAPEVPLVKGVVEAELGRPPEQSLIWDEAFAVYVAGLPGGSGFHAAAVGRCRSLQEEDLLPPLEALLAGSREHVPTTAATVLAGFIKHLIERRGKARLGDLLRAVRRDPGDAFQIVYRQPISVADRNWRRGFGARSPHSWRSTSETLSRLMPLIRPFWVDLLRILAYSLIGIAFSLALPLSFRLLIDHILGRRPLTGPVPFIGPTGHVISQGDEQIKALLVLLGGLTGLFVLNAASRVRLTALSASVGEAFLYRLRDRMLTTLGMLPVSYFARISPADVSQRVMVDSATLQQSLVAAVIPLATSVISIAVYGATLVSMEHRLSMIILLGLPLLALIDRFRRSAIRNAARERVRRVTSLTGKIIELTTLNVLAKVYLAVPALVGQLRVLLGIHQQLNVAYSRESATFSQTAILVAHLIQVAVLFAGGYLVVTSEGRDLAAGGLASFYVLLNQVFSPIAQITASRQALVEAGPSIDRVYQLLEETAEPNYELGASLGPLRDALVLESLSFGYAPNRPVIHDISVQIQAGSTTAFVGPTGCGKSTIVSLLPRLYDPWEGFIRWDGYDIRRASLSSLRKQIALVPQDAPALNASIYDNIVFGLAGVTSEEVVAAAQAAQADAFIQLLPDGYDTVIGERGLGLSGGQRQRIALARALLRNPCVLILDEATSALDPTTQRNVQEHLRDGRLDRTIIKIAHRLETVADADKIVVLEDGLLVEQGTHGALLERDGVYARLFRDQMRLIDTTGKPTVVQAVQWLKRLPRFAHLGSADMEELERLMHISVVHRGDVIVPAGAQSSSTTIIGHGRAEVVLIDDSGYEHVVGTLGPGDILGRDGDTGARPRDTAVRAMTDVQVFVLDQDRIPPTERRSREDGSDSVI